MKKSIYNLLLALLLPLSVAAQHTVRGTVTSDGEPLIGASILVIGTTTGTVTDLDGTFEVTATSPNDSLEFSYTGYGSQRIAINGRSVIDVNLAEQAALLEEIVVVGYGVQRKSDLTGAVATIQSEELTNIPTQSVGQALQGKVAGLQIIPSNGAPGADAIFRIRGTGSFEGAAPLFVVDGMIVNDISFVNPQDVENISVLKDASATAIYGARGANGVIIVTTKKGKSGESRINVSSYYGTQEVIRKIEVTNATEYATLANELAANEGRPPIYSDPASLGAGTDWQDVIFQMAPTQNHQISFLGGGERSQYNISANYYGQEGIIRGSDYDRVTLRFNGEYKLKDYLRFGNNVSLVYSQYQGGPNVLLAALRSAPTVPVRNEDGTYGNPGDVSNTPNVEASIFYNNNEGTGYRTVGNVYLDADLIPGLTFRTNLGLDFFLNENQNFVPLYFVSAIQQTQQNQLTLVRERNRNWLWENTLTYNREWDNLRFDALVGVTAQDNFGERLSASRQNFIDERETFWFLDAGEQGTEAIENAPLGDYGLLSYLGRVNVTLLDRYLFTVTGRIDESSRFGSNFRSGFFPSFAFGWNIGNEAFMQDQNLFSRLKLRTSWGQTGNDRIGDFTYTSLVELGQSAVFGRDENLNNGATLIALANPNLRWEETTQFDVGLEFGFFNNKLQGEVDYYRRVSDDVLYRSPIPSYLGADAPAQNVASILNRGWDFTLNWQESVSSNFSYNLRGIVSLLHNEVLQVNALDQTDLFGGGVGFSGILGTNSRKGYPVGGFFGYIVDGIYQNQADLDNFPRITGQNQRPGDLRFRDVNGDGVISPADRTLIGKPTPDVTYSFSGGVQVSGFDVSIEFLGQAGYELINAKRAARFGLYNFERSFLDRWTGEGTSTTEPRLTTSGINYDFFSTRFIEPGDFLRLRNVEIGYSLPQSLLDRLNFSRLRIYVSGNNLVTWTDFTGYTPEIFNNNVFDVGIDLGQYPIAKTYLVGLDLSF